MKFLGLDFGMKRIGIALSDEKGSFAFPRETIPNDVSAIDRIADVVRKEGVGTVVVGDTRAANGEENEVTQRAEQFISALEKHLGFSVVRVREAWSSFEAGRFSPSGEHDDAAAAAIILQRHLDQVSKPLTDTDVI